MGATVIVVDTNQIRDFPLLDSCDWSELISRAEDWDLRFVMPEVVLRESVSVVARKWLAKRAEVAKPKLAELGLEEAQKAMLDAVDNQIEGYEAALRGRLVAIGVEIVPIPESVTLLDVAQRAIDRRKPYPEGDGTKDGFRDTLIWHTVRGVAAGDRDCEVWLISVNHNDWREFRG